MLAFHEKMSDLLFQGDPFVCVTIVDTIGSVPLEAGAKMLVTPKGLHYGTVGGGKVEARTIQECQRLLSEGVKVQFVQWALDRDIGMTCGGSVKLYFESFNQGYWHITVFGAGHVANALVRILLGLDCRILCIDSRKEWLDKMPDSAKLTKLCLADMVAEVERLRPDAFVLLMTMGHSTDMPILLEILKSRGAAPFPYLGVIGSAAKAARLKKDVREAGLSPARWPKESG